MWIILAAAFIAQGSSSLSTDRSLSTSPAQGSGTTLPQNKVVGSEVLTTSYSVEKGTASEFLIQNFIEVEKTVATQNKDPKKRDQVLNQKIKTIVSRILDVEGLGKRAMVTYWDELGKTLKGKKQRQEYMTTFRKLVEENYLDKAQQYIGGKYQIPLIGERKESDLQIVTGRIKKQDVDVMVEFKIQGQKGSYQIRDVKLDDTSLEASYRGSFNRIIRKKNGLKDGFPELLRVMKERLHDLQTGQATRL